MISDEAVETGIWAYMRSLNSGYDRSFQAPPRNCEREAMRAALEAAMPHMLASQEAHIRKLVYDYSVPVAPSSSSGPMIVGHQQFDALVKALVNPTKEA